MMMIPIIANVMMVMFSNRWRAAPCENTFYDDGGDDFFNDGEDENCSKVLMMILINSGKLVHG